MAIITIDTLSPSTFFTDATDKSDATQLLAQVEQDLNTARISTMEEVFVVVRMQKAPQSEPKEEELNPALDGTDHEVP